MATVKMLAKISGTRNGLDWPDPGETIELPDAEAEQLVTQKLAKSAPRTASTLVGADHVDHSREIAIENAAKRAAKVEAADEPSDDEAESTVLKSMRK
jgi:superfamily II DNA or RNA helicase